VEIYCKVDLFFFFFFFKKGRIPGICCLSSSLISLFSPEIFCWSYLFFLLLVIYFSFFDMRFLHYASFCFEDLY
jgi:hypothetical protein